MLNKIKKACKNLSGAKQEVAVFTLSNPDTVAFMTIDELASSAGVSASTVSRAAAEMGYRGFPEMQEEVRVFLKQRLLPTERLERASISEGSFGFRESLSKDIENIQMTAERISEKTFNQAVKLLCEAREVNVAGMRTQYGAASFFSLVLEQVRGGVNLITLNEGRYPEQLLRMTSEDVMVAICFPRYAKFTVSIVEEAERLGCRIIALTDGALSPVGLMADVVIPTEYESQSFFNSTVAANAVLNALATGVALANKTEALQRVGKHSEICKRWNILMDTDE